MTDRDRLSRPRLVSLWRRVTPGATVLVTAQHRSGVATSVREWLAETDQTLVRWSSNRTDVPADLPDADVVLLELEGMRDGHITATQNVRERWPNATLIAVSSTQWPPGLLDLGIRPERVFSGSLFGFTADEVLDRAEQLGLPLTWDEATGLIERVGSHAGFVDAVLRAAAARGALDDAAVHAGCDEATAHFAGSAAAGVFRPNGWHAVLVSARIGPMPRRTLIAVWNRDEVVRAALDNILQSGFFVQDLDRDTIELRPDIRAAIIERMEREAQIEQVDSAVAALASQLLTAGNTDDGWAVVADLPAARTRLLARHWWQIGETDVERARPWLEEAVLRDPDPLLRLALARTLIDITSANHSGSIPEDARRTARDLLDELGALCTDAQLVAETLRGVLLRLEGRFDEAVEMHERLADESAGATADSGSPSALRSLVQTHVLLQAGLSALDAARVDLAADRFAAAAALAHSTEHERLARFAHEMLLLVTPGGAPDPSGFQARIDSLVGAHVSTPAMRRLVSLSSALYVMDPCGLQEALDDVDAPVVDDPLVLRFVSVALRTMAHGILGTAHLGVRELELFSQSIEQHPLSPTHEVLLLWARTESLTHSGAGDRALQLLDDAPAAAARIVPLDVLRARAHLREKAPERALACLASAPATQGSGVLPVWSHVVLFLAYHAIGSESSLDVARQHLSSAIVAASRARPLLPFAMQGMGALNTTIQQAEQIALDPAGRRFVDELIRMRDALQLATSATLTLSERERTVVAHLTQASSTKDLAQRLHVSPNTVKTQLRSIYRKLGVTSWAEAVSAARRLGLAE